MSPFANRHPASDANRANNAAGDRDRAIRWEAARDAAWNVVGPLVTDGGRVLIVGAGNVHDLPVQRIAQRAGAVTLLDLDGASMRRAVRMLPAGMASRVDCLELDVTGGAADTVVHGARHARGSVPVEAPTDAFPGSPYDLVIGDLLYSQLLYPGLKRLGVKPARRRETLVTHGPRLTSALVARLTASARPGGHVVHLHDVACWADGSPQPATIAAALADPELVVPTLGHPTGCDPDDALHTAGIDVVSHAWWEWRFASTATYLVRATVTRA